MLGHCAKLWGELLYIQRLIGRTDLPMEGWTRKRNKEGIFRINFILNSTVKHEFVFEEMRTAYSSDSTGNENQFLASENVDVPSRSSCGIVQYPNNRILKKHAL